MVGTNKSRDGMISGVTENAAAGVRGRKVAALSDYQKTAIGKITVDLEAIAKSAVRGDKKSINKLVGKFKEASESGVLPDEAGLGPAVVIKQAKDAIEELKKIITQKNNLIKQSDELKRSSTKSGVFGEVGIGAVNAGAIPLVRAAAGNSDGRGVSGDNVLKGYHGVIDKDVLEKVKNFSGEPFFNKPGFTYRKSLEIASADLGIRTRAEIRNIESVIGKGFNTHDKGDESVSKIPDGTGSSYNGEKITEFMSSVLGKPARALMNKSTAVDSRGRRKFQKRRDESLETLSGSLKEGGIGTAIINSIKESMIDDGLLDSNTFSQLLEELNKKRKADNEGISQEIINEVNEINKTLISVAKSESANEDSMFRMRLLQIALLATLFFAIPFAAPIIGAFAGAIFGGLGVGAGSASLMGASFLGPLASVGGLFEPIVGTILTQTPLLGQALGVVDFALGVPAVGGAVISLAGMPLVPIAAAALVGTAIIGDQKYIKEKGIVDDKFKEGNKKLDKITSKYIDADTTKNAGGDLADENKSREFVEKKYGLLKSGHKIAAMTNFIDAINVACQQQEDFDLSNIFSQELIDHLQGGGLSSRTIASNKDVLKETVAGLFYDDANGAFMNEINSKFGLCSYISEASENIHIEDSVDELIKMVRAGDSTIASKSTIGANLYDARYDILYGLNNGVEIDRDIGDARFSDISDDDRGLFVGDLQIGADKAKEAVVSGECALIKEAIKSRSVDDALFAAYSGKRTEIPGVSPSNGDAVNIKTDVRVGDKSGSIQASV